MKTFISQWHNLKRQKVYIRCCFVFYMLLAVADNRNFLLVADLEAQVYRHLFQQIILVFGNILLTMCVVNEQFFCVYDNLLSLYLKNEKRFFITLMLVLYGATVVPFILGQVLFLGLSLWMGSFISIKLWLVNLGIVLCEIVISLNLAVALNFLLKKDILVYVAYYLFIFTCMVTDNVYVALPLNMRVLDTQGYYYSFGAPLWIGRLIGLAVSIGGLSMSSKYLKSL